MSRPNQPALSAAQSLLVLGLIVLPAAGIGYLVTTFLFAFSGGQSRMVPVVNETALGVIAIDVVIAAIAWRLRSPIAAIKSTAVATGALWVTAIVVEWLVSFWLGA